MFKLNLFLSVNLFWLFEFHSDLNFFKWFDWSKGMNGIHSIPLFACNQCNLPGFFTAWAYSKIILISDVTTPAVPSISMKLLSTCCFSYFSLFHFTYALVHSAICINWIQYIQIFKGYSQIRVNLTISVQYNRSFQMDIELNILLWTWHI